MNAKQLEAFSRVCEGTNLLLTGPAGTGKSFTLNEIVAWAHSEGKEIGVTASTGLSAFLINGRTIHSFLGIGLGKRPVKDTANLVRYKNKVVLAKVLKLDMLIIDEVSMLDSALLDYISAFLVEIRGVDKPFGGVQVILCGDFCQLPPVDGQFCFLADVWKKASIETVVLEELVRQDSDTTFQRMLKELRWGVCSKETLAILQSLRASTFPEGIVPTKLFSTNRDIDSINLANIAKLKAAGARTLNYSSSSPSSSMKASWCNQVPDTIELCVGAQVIVTSNLPGTSIVNGSRGVVLDLQPAGVAVRLLDGSVASIPFVKITNPDDDKSSVSFMPLKLAYAISIHKSQGMTLDAVEIDIGDSIFEFGQAYVALSRARTLQSIRIVDVRAGSFKTHPLVKSFYDHTS